MEQETCQSVPPVNAVTTVDLSGNWTGFEGKRGYKELGRHREMFNLYCDKLVHDPDKRVKDILAEIAHQYNLSPSTLDGIYENGCWPTRFREWRKQSKEIAVHDPRYRVSEMVKDLEKLATKGSSVLYEWMGTLEAKKLVGKEIELISNIVLKAVELASKTTDTLPQPGGGINIKGNNVQLIIKE